MEGKPKIIIFTDLDGTLLSHITYSYREVLPQLKELKRRRVPIIFCTAKTRAENEWYQKKLKINDPFIVENGGAIFIPKNYFDFPFSYDKEEKKYLIIKLGAPYSELKKALEKIRKEARFKIKGFGDMTVKEIAKDSGLPIELAKLAKKREYNESFNFYDATSRKEKILATKLKQFGIKLTHGGRYYDILGKNAGKGKAVLVLTKLFKKEFGEIKTIGLGDSLNDLSLLERVDLPILVQKHSGDWDPGIISGSKKIKNLQKIKEIGPKGWVKAIKKYVLSI